MGYVRGDDRGQGCLLPSAIEDYVPGDAPVRVIDAFVDQLDIAGLGFGRAVPAATGRPPYDPRDLLKLYVYGYFNEVRSPRRLERECHRNIEAMWLLRRLCPDFKTIADFRRDNGPAIVGVCRAFVMLCRDTGLFSARLIALDGSKFRAVASSKKIMGQRQIAEETARLDTKIAAYLAGLEDTDATEPDDAPDAVSGAIATLQARQAELNRLATSLEFQERTLIVEGEEDARPMGRGNGLKPPSYNVQIAADAETGLIVHHAVTDEAIDNRLLHPMATATRQALGQESLTVVADAGYSNGAHATACEQEGIVVCAPANRSVNTQADGVLFDRTAFTYEPQTDTYRCPDGRQLVRKQLHRKKRNVTYVSADCTGCALKPQCTTADRRSLKRHLDEEALNRMSARATPQVMAKRRCAAEYPFGILKRMTTGGRFLTRNLKGTRTEMALSVLAYNLLRAINLKTSAA